MPTGKTEIGQTAKFSQISCLSSLQLPTWRAKLHKSSCESRVQRKKTYFSFQSLPFQQRVTQFYKKCKFAADILHRTVEYFI